MSTKIISPSLLAADFANLERDIQKFNDSKAQWLHIDIMDGVFVPNISYGMPVLKAVGKHTTKPLDVHLMIVDPDRYIDVFAELGDRKSTRLNSSHVAISYAVFCLKKKTNYTS